MGGNYGKVIEDLYKKYNINDKERYNPLTVKKIILADDDPNSNYTLRATIEQCGRYQVLPFYSGADVISLLFIIVRRISATKKGLMK